jgi:hypothetical protein
MILNSRRNFLKSSFLSSLLLITCNKELFGAITPLGTIRQLHLDLFPQNSFVPSKNDINAYAYLNFILNHSYVTDDTKKFIQNGARWLNEESVLKYKKVYTALYDFQRQKILKEISKTAWGESWLETIMSYFFEAMLGDPIYGGNRAQSGWKWLNHKSGLPRPTKALS